MVDELRDYIDKLFEDLPKTRSNYGIKEEILSNSLERYFDLVEEGIPEKEAVEIVIESIGDINSLFIEDSEFDKNSDEELKKVALYKSVAIGLYIFAVALFLGISAIVEAEELGLVVMLIIMAIATCILVYASTAYPKYKKKEDTIIEEFKEYNSDKIKSKSVEKAINAIVWLIIVTLYLLISFTTNAWHITWIIFLVGACISSIISLMFQLRR